LLDAFRGIRQLLEQLQPAARERNCVPVRKPADVVFCRVLEILCGPLVVSGSLKVHCKLCRNFYGVLTVHLLSPFPYPLVELDTPGCRYAFVQHILVQSVNEAVPPYCLSIRKHLDATALNKLMLTSQLIETRFQCGSIFL
jgi:hypothetical protein